MNNYLIPANSKKSQLILGMFTMGDLIVFLVGVTITVALLLVFKTNSMAAMIGFASPALLAALLVAPVPNYHNVMQLISNAMNPDIVIRVLFLIYKLNCNKIYQLLQNNVTAI